MKLKSREINIFSMSALDLFASALGAFLLLSVVTMPFFPNTGTHDANAAQKEQAEHKTTKEALKKAQAEADAAKKAAEQAKAEAQAAKEAAKKAASKVKFQLPDLDIVICLDVTGSMKAQIEGLKKEISDLIDVLKKLSPSLGMGVIAYGDDNFDSPITYQRKIYNTASSADLSQLKSFISDVTIDMGMGSGKNNTDGESLHAALEAAVKLPWRNASKERYIVIFTDDEPTRNKFNATLSIASSFATNSAHKVAVVRVKERGNDIRTKLQQIASAGKGEFVDAANGGSFMSSLLLAIVK